MSRVLTKKVLPTKASRKYSVIFFQFRFSLSCNLPFCLFLKIINDLKNLGHIIMKFGANLMFIIIKMI